MSDSNKFSLHQDLKNIKIDSAVRRLKIAYNISIVLGIFTLISDIITNGVFCNAEEKITNLISYGTMIYLKRYIESNKPSSRLISIIYGEFINFVLIYFAYIKEKNYSILWTQLAPFVSMYYQGYLIESKLGAFTLSLKHTLTWTISGYYFSMFSISEIPLITSCTAGICMLMSCCIYLNHLQDLDLCESREKLKKSNLQLNSLLESTQSFIVVISSAKKMEFCNSIFKKIIKNEDVIKFLKKIKYFQRYSQQDKCLTLYEDILNTFKLPVGTRNIFGITQKNGAFIEWEGKIDIWGDDLVTFLIGRDVTSLLKLKQESKESQYKTALLRTVTHELRTPTNAMLMMSQCLLDSKEITCENKDKVRIITSSCNYLLCLINDLLDYSQIITGCLKTVKVSFNLLTLMRECVKILELDLAMTNITAHLISRSVIPENIKTDPYRLKQILINLLNNSRKFTKAGKIWLIVRIKNNFLKIACKDTGIGIKDREINKLFKIFGKIEDQVNNPQGAGLGLYISNMLVKELGGDDIKLKSEEGKGSKFSFSIPIEIGESEIEVKRDDVSSNSEQVLGAKPTGKYNILIVDDTYFNVLLFFQVLQPEGFLCSYAMNGAEAIKLVLSNEFDCIIMDCEMPIMDGLETTEKLHKMLMENEIKNLPPIIGATAHDNDFMNIKCKNAGMNDILFKPCTKDQIIEKVNYWIKSYQFM